MTIPPRVFISYSHDSADHCDRVLALAQQLRRDGIAAELDQFHQEELLHWPRWCEEQMRPEHADFVLCVCTAEYARRVEGRAAANVGKGVFWEGTLIYSELYDAKGNPRCVPVLLDGGTDADIPRILRGWSWFRLDAFGLADTDSGYAKLWRLVNRQASITPATVGALPILERKTDFMAEIAKQLAGIKDDTQAILANQAAHQALLARITESARTYRPGALHQLKAPPEHFTGRAESLAQVCATLRQGGTVAVSAVNGLGGIGKTALAIMAAHAVRAEFPDMQLFIELRAHSPNPVTAAAARDSVLQAAHPEARLPDSEDARWALYRALFEGKRALVVLDDAADDAQVEALKPPPGSALLVTSRRQLRTGESLRLDKLPRAEAVDLLRAWAPRLTAAEAERLAGLCGDLPVALKAAGGYLKAYRAKPVAEYLAALEANRLQRLKNPDQPADDVNVIFEASYRALTEPERGAWAALAIMSADFGREAGKAVIESADAGDVLDRLVNLNLLEYGEESGRFGWHDLLREFAAFKLPLKNELRARIRHAQHFAVVGEQADKLYLSGHFGVKQGLALFRREYHHFDSAILFLASNFWQSSLLVRLMDGIVYTSMLCVPPRQRITWLKHQKKAACRTLNLSQFLNSIGNLGVCYGEIGQFDESLKYFKQHLNIVSILGNDICKIKDLGHLGNIYYLMNEKDMAIKFYNAQLKLARKLSEWREMDQATFGLGQIYFDLGKLDIAKEYAAICLDISSNRGKRYGEIRALDLIGKINDKSGNFDAAIDCYSKAIEKSIEIGDLHGKGGGMWNLALVYYRLGDKEKAISFAQEGLAILEGLHDYRVQAGGFREVLAEWRAEPDPGSE